MGAEKFKLEMINPDAQGAFNYLCIYSSGVGLKSKGSFVMKKPPPGVEVAEWIDAIIKGRLSDKLRAHLAEFELQLREYLDTSGPAICFQASRDASFMKFIFLGCTA